MFSRVFFKKVLCKALVCILLSSPFYSVAFNKNIILETKCVKDIIIPLYPYVLKGEESPTQSDIYSQSDIFFRCIKDLLELVAVKNYYIHPSERDHFIRREVFNWFHSRLGYDKEKSQLLTHRLLFIKKLLVGGSIDTIKDQELDQLYDLVDYYKEIYLVLHKEISVLKNLVQGKKINLEGKEKTLDQVGKAVILLSRAYQSENVSYTVEDLSKYSEYIKRYSEYDTTSLQALFTILKNLLQGSIYPHQEIQGKHWDVFVNVIRRSFDFIFYYNEYMLKEKTEIQFAFNSLLTLEHFLPLLSSNEELYFTQGFPIENIDNILQAVLQLFISQGDSPSFLSDLQDKKKIRFFTRALFAFSLNPKDSHKGQADWETEDSHVNFSFNDYNFQFYNDHFTQQKKKSDSLFVSSEQIQDLKTWILYYQDDILDIHKGYEQQLARDIGLEHWLSAFFGWNETNEIIYGEELDLLGQHESSNNSSKMLHFLGYQSFLSLLLNKYVSEDFFATDRPVEELSEDQWMHFVSELSPLFFVTFGQKSFPRSVKKSLQNLFTVADLFMNSSDVNGSLNRKEFLDLSIHLISALKKSQKTFPLLLDLCDTSIDFSTCVTKAFIKEPEILKNYPRFKDYLDINKSLYQKYISSILKDLERDSPSFSLVELFFLIQIMETNYYRRINQGIDTNLDSDELLVFSESLKEQIRSSVPYLYNSDQALAFILYSFQSKEIPFFTGDEFEALRFSHWYLNSKARSSFSINPRDFHKLGFEFYNLYKRF